MSQKREGQRHIIAVDIGNTNIVLGWIEGQKIVSEFRFRTDRLKTWEEYLLLMKASLDIQGFSLEQVEGSIVSSVVPNLRGIFKQALERLTGKPCLVVGPGMKTGLVIHMDNPSSLGSDLVVDAVAAKAKYPLPLAIFDLGTATTLSILDERGIYQGGLILPGLRLSVDALAEGTSSLPYIQLHRPQSLLGKNTVDCMNAGAIYAHAAMLDGLLERAEAEMGQPLTAVATGGLVDQVLPFCRRRILSSKTLTLEGLLLLYEKNQAEVQALEAQSQGRQAMHG